MVTTPTPILRGDHAKAFRYAVDLITSGPGFGAAFPNPVNVLSWKGEGPEDGNGPASPDQAWIRFTPRLGPAEPLCQGIDVVPLWIDIELSLPGTDAGPASDAWGTLVRDRLFPEWGTDAADKLDDAFGRADKGGVSDRSEGPTTWTAGSPGAVKGTIRLDIGVRAR